MGAGEQREQEPVFISQASQSQRLELLIYRLRTPGPRTAPASPAAAIIVWPRPGRAICSARRAAPLPPQTRLRAVPNAHPPSPLCISQHGRLPGYRHKKASPEPRQDPSPKPWGEKANRAIKNRSWSTKSPRLSVLTNPPVPAPPPLLITTSLFFLPVSPGSRYTQPFSASLRCHYASGLKSLLFLKNRRKSPESPLRWGREMGKNPFPRLPHQAPGVQPRSTQPGEQYPSFNHAYSIWDPFAYTPQAGTAASRSDNKRIQRIWRAT